MKNSLFVKIKRFLCKSLKLRTISQLFSASFRSSFRSLMQELLSEFCDLLSAPALSVSAITSGFLAASKLVGFSSALALLRQRTRIMAIAITTIATPITQDMMTRSGYCPGKEKSFKTKIKAVM